MKRFLAIYIGTEQALERSGWNELDDKTCAARDAEGVEAWMKWGEQNAARIVDVGAPLGKTKRVSTDGVKTSRTR